MKILVLTAIFGGKDTPKPFPKQSIDCDYICVTEENSPFPLPNLPDRLKAKYFKLQAHWAFPVYDAYVWIDGNIEVISADFVKDITSKISKNKPGICIQHHHERQTIEQEVQFILNSDNPYLKTRYGNQPLKQEYEHYLSEGLSPDAQLFACNIFAWVPGCLIDAEPESNFFNQWWKLVLEWSWFDQIAFSRAHKIYAWQTKFHVIHFGPMFNNPYFILHPHTIPLG